MANDKPEGVIQIWQHTCQSEEQRDDIRARCIRIEGCSILFIGKDGNGKDVVIKSLTGTAIHTPATEYTGHHEFPHGPETEMLMEYNISIILNLETSRL